ncbi:unnamed protein product [Callosobruchus maculatus]|uniref:Thyroglobulin type-1 domain-containing protein n=1 Tax=Callosobruchus maculatus TaxID=64391 RepID=A0A653CWX9_CALMS|nr:unnamed protein product [Callosobruchus maculatus]
MRVLLVVVLVSIAAGTVQLAQAKRKRNKFEGDFEFAEEDENRSNKSAEKKRWIHDPSSDLCRPLNCKKKEICLLEDTFTAVCVSRKELKKNGDIVVPKPSTQTEESKDEEDDDVFYDTEDEPESDSEDETDSGLVCKACPVVKPVFLCGSDNRTYSSLCRLDYHNCIHHTAIRVVCKGFCPCKENSEERLRKKQRQADKLNLFMSKYKATLDKTGGASGGAAAPALKPPLSRSPLLPPFHPAVSKADQLYTYTPQDFKYDNKHYKYIKYTKYNNNKEVNGNAIYSEDKERMRGYNEVLEDDKMAAGGGGKGVATDKSQASSAVQKQCSPAALQAMGNRLLDWFSVVMADTANRKRRLFFNTNAKAGAGGVSVASATVHVTAGATAAIGGSGVGGCKKPEVKWMFEHLDANGDGRLSLQELYDLEHDQREACLKPFLQRCDADRDAAVSRAEWCRCFQRSERPCKAVHRKIMHAANADINAHRLPGGVYVPDCDGQGYYKPVQCHSAIGMCWCVDKHGVEFANSRTHAKPNCDPLLSKDNELSKQLVQSSNSVDNNNSEGDSDDEDDHDQDVEGSADHPSDY